MISSTWLYRFRWSGVSHWSCSTTGLQVYFSSQKKNPTDPSVIYFLSCHEVETATDRPTKVLQYKAVHTESINYTCLSSITHAGLLGTLSFDWVLILCIFKASIHLASDGVIGRDLFDVPSLGIAVGSIDRSIIFREFFTLYKTMLHAF